jgi:hypothetical protein
MSRKVVSVVVLFSLGIVMTVAALLTSIFRTAVPNTDFHYDVSLFTACDEVSGESQCETFDFAACPDSASKLRCAAAMEIISLILFVVGLVLTFLYHRGTVSSKGMMAVAAVTSALSFVAFVVLVASFYNDHFCFNGLEYTEKWRQAGRLGPGVALCVVVCLTELVTVFVAWKVRGRPSRGGAEGDEAAHDPAIAFAQGAGVGYRTV